MSKKPKKSKKTPKTFPILLDPQAVDAIAKGAEAYCIGLRFAIVSWILSTANKVETLVAAKKIPDTAELARVIHERTLEDNDFHSLISGNPLLIASCMLGIGTAAYGIPDNKQAARYHKPFFAELNKNLKSDRIERAVWTVAQLSVLDVLLERGLDLPELRELRRKSS
jgi:hypothetical protein